MSAPSSPPTVTLTPPGAAWSALIERRAAETAANPEAQRFRKEIGLPSTGRVVMSGHQAQWWHAGILAKQIALAAACRRTGATGAWVVVDQDASESFTLSYPAQRSGPQPAQAAWAIAPPPLADHARADVALRDLPPFTPAHPPADAPTPDVARGLRAIADSAARWTHAPTAAAQIAHANAELVSAATPDTPSPTLVFGSALLRTTAGRALLERMAEDPRACVESYNRAVAEVRAAGIAPLSFVPDRDRYELPLWQLSSSAAAPTPRKRVFAATLGEAPLNTLAPRALLMTGLLRWLGCDLFIHGTGGGATGHDGGYDATAERWFSNWLGVRIAPSVTATATLLLPLGVGPTVTEDDLRTAHRRVEDARHAPRSLNDERAQAEKDRLVAAIAASRDRSERARLYRSLQTHLESYRTAHAAELAHAADRTQSAARDLAAQAVLRNRTWPWPLLPRTMVLELRRRIDAELAGEGPSA